MKVSEIEIWRDGGTITFKVLDTQSAGDYRLQTPWLGEPRPLFRENRQLDFGSVEEAELLAGLDSWLKHSLTPELAESLKELDQLNIWLNLPENLVKAVPLHRIRTVIECLRRRAN